MKVDSCPAVDGGEDVGGGLGEDFQVLEVDDGAVVAVEIVQVLDDGAGSLKAMAAGSFWYF